MIEEFGEGNGEEECPPPFVLVGVKGVEEGGNKVDEGEKENDRDK